MRKHIANLLWVAACSAAGAAIGSAASWLTEWLRVNVSERLAAYFAVAFLAVNLWAIARTFTRREGR